jgi:hypothetical protein
MKKRFKNLRPQEIVTVSLESSTYLSLASRIILKIWFYSCLVAKKGSRIPGFKGSNDLTIL